MADGKSTRQSNKKINLSLDYRLVIAALVLMIVSMLLVWKPWSLSHLDDSRVIEVTGDVTIKSEPDEYVFSPNYQFKNANKETALSELTSKSDEIIKKLKELGVSDNNIKSNASGYNDYNYFYDSRMKTNNYTLQLTITLDNRDHTQEVQDYLISTEPSGNISPQAMFSEVKLKELESQARDEATKVARDKAEQSGRNLGFKVGKVKSVVDEAGFGEVYPYLSLGTDLETAEISESQLSVQPGENELNYSVTVVYYIH